MEEKPGRIQRKRNPKWLAFSSLADFIPVIALAEPDLGHDQDSVATDASRVWLFVA